MHRALLVALCLVSLPFACKGKEPGERAKTAATKKDFWPDAPAATAGKTPRTFVYKPENINGYMLIAKGGSPEGAAVSLSYDMTLDLDFKAGATPRERDAYIKRVELSMDAMSQSMKMLLDGTAISVRQGSEPEVKFTRDEPGPFDVGGMTDKPFTTLAFPASGKVEIKTIPDHPFNTLGGTGDMLDNSLLLFPDLPPTPIAPGHAWTKVHDTPVGATGSRVDVTYTFTYVGDSTCPSGAPACSLFTFSARSASAQVQTEGVSVDMSYGFAGKIFFDTDRGTVDESRVRMDLDGKAQGQTLQVGGTFIVKPTKS